MNGFDDFVARRDGLPDSIAGPKLEVLHQREHEGVRHRHREDLLLHSHSDAVARERDVFGDQDNRGGIRGGFGQIDVREPELIGQRLGNRVRIMVEERLQLRDYRSDDQSPVTVSVGVLVAETVNQGVQADLLLEEAEEAVPARRRLVAIASSMSTRSSDARRPRRAKDRRSINRSIIGLSWPGVWSMGAGVER